MKWTAAVYTPECMKGVTPDEVILHPKECARLGRLPLADCEAQAHEWFARGVRPVLNWDVLQTEADFQRTCQQLRQLNWTSFSALRVQEMGAMQFALDELNIPLHLILETAHHNWQAIEALLDYAKDRIERVVLSLELPKETVADYTQKLHQRGIEVELMGLGPLLLFYTPRKLLGVRFEDEFTPEWIESLATSEESPHSGFAVVENQHGTFMFNPKDHGLIDLLDVVAEVGLDWLRLDLSGVQERALHQELAKLWDGMMKGERERGAQLKERYPKKLFRGFFGANRTDRLFPKLKNSRLQKRDDSFVAEVVDAAKDSHVALIVRDRQGLLKRGDRLMGLSPEGRERQIVVKSLRNSRGEEVESLSFGQIGLMPWTGGMVRKTMLYRNQEPTV